MSPEKSGRSLKSLNQKPEKFSRVALLRFFKKIITARACELITSIRNPVSLSSSNTIVTLIMCHWLRLEFRRRTFAFLTRFFWYVLAGGAIVPFGHPQLVGIHLRFLLLLLLLRLAPTLHAMRITWAKGVDDSTFGCRAKNMSLG